MARVYDYYLYESDLETILPKNQTKEDSLKFVRAYIESWINQKLLLKKAEENLSPEAKAELNIEKRLEDYKNSLLTHAFESEIIKQKLDTFIKEEEIIDYYTKNKNNFELKNNIVKVLYIKVNKKAPTIQKIKNWYKSTNPKDSALLEEYCLKYAENFYLDSKSWLYWDDLLKEIPIETYNQELFLRNNRYIEVEDSNSIYLVNIKDFKIKNNISPITLERQNIRNILLNKRKQLLIAKMKEDLYTNALKNKEFEIY